MRNRIINLLSFAFYKQMLYVNQRLKMQIKGKEHLDSLKKEGKNAIFAFWHGSSFMLFYVYKFYLDSQNMCILTTESFKGGVLSRLAEHHFGYDAIQTPTKTKLKKEIKVALHLVHALNNGSHGAIAVDGPLGPYHEAKRGIFHIAFEAECPIIPIGTFALKKYAMKRWDKYFIPFPGSPAAVVLGEPIPPPHELDPRMIEYKRKQLERALDEVTKEAERLTSQTSLC